MPSHSHASHVCHQCHMEVVNLNLNFFFEFKLRLGFPSYQASLITNIMRGNVIIWCNKTTTVFYWTFMSTPRQTIISSSPTISSCLSSHCCCSCCVANLPSLSVFVYHRCLFATDFYGILLIHFKFNIIFHFLFSKIKFIEHYWKQSSNYAVLGSE